MAVTGLTLFLGLIQVERIDPQNLSHTLVRVMFKQKFDFSPKC